MQLVQPFEVKSGSDSAALSMIGLLPPVGDSARFYRLEPLRLGYRILSSRAEAEGKAQEDLLGNPNSG